jgi:serine/threonine protein kinase/predicted negative regulator of RcsB-dependent stress response
MAANTMECPQCHSANAATAEFCVKCQTPFSFDGATMATAPLSAPTPDAPSTTPKSTPAAPPGATAEPFDPDATLAAVPSAAPRPASSGSAAGWSNPAQPASAFAALAGAPLQPGTVLGNRYEIISMLGQGGMGAVYKATDREVERAVALKVIRPELAVRPEILQRFKQELILARQVTHRNVIRIFDLGDADGIKFITMEYIEGQDLRSLVTEKGKLTPEETVRIFEQVCLALEAAHAEGVVHRDLKPQNIMIDKQGKVAVMDFGIARSVDVGGMTQTGMLVGTPEYMSPEQVMGEHVDVRSDLFTLGVILFELLTSSMPYKADTIQAAMFKRTRERPKPAIDVDPTVPPFLSAVAAKCLEMDPTVRYQTARQIITDLESWRRGATQGPTVVIPPAISAPPPASKKWIAVASAGAVIALAGISVLVFHDRISSRGAESVSGPEVSLAILPFRNTSGDASLDWLGSNLAETLSTDVGESSHLRMVSSERVGQILHDLKISAETSLDLPTIQHLAEFSNADTVVWGQYAKFGDKIRIDATVQDLKRSRATKVSETSDEKDVLTAIDHLAADIRQNLTLSSSVVRELQGQSFKPSTTSLPALHDYNDGLQLARQGNALGAVDRFLSSAKQDPQFALAYAELSKAYDKLGQDSEAEQASRKAVDLSQNLPVQEKYRIQATHDRIQKDYPKAIETYETLAKNAPDDGDVLFDLASLYEKSGDWDKALKDFTRVLTLDPKRVDALLATGRVNIESGNVQGGLEFLTRAQGMAIELGDQEERGQILQAMGIAYWELNKFDDAMHTLQEALALNQKLGLKKGIADNEEMIASTEWSLGKLDLALKDYNAALALRREIGDKSGTGDVLNDLAQFYDDRTQYDQALKLLKESLQIQIDVGNDRGQGLVLHNIGNTYLSKGDYENARTYFEQALQIREKLKNPTDIADTVHDLAETSTKLGSYDQALQQYVRALDLRRSLNDERSAAIESSSMGILFGYQGRYGAALSSEEDALKFFRDIQERTVWTVEILSAYGNALAEVGRSDDAQKALDEALALARELKDQAHVASTLEAQGDNQFYRGDMKAALALYTQARQEAIRTGDEHLILVAEVNLARVNVKVGKYPLAITALRQLSEQADTMGLKYLSVECSVYLAEALLGEKDFKKAQPELQNALARSEKLGLRSLQAQSHQLFGKALQLQGETQGASAQYQQAKAILDDIQKESKSDAIAKRSDLAPIANQSPS